MLHGLCKLARRQNPFSNAADKRQKTALISMTGPPANGSFAEAAVTEEKGSSDPQAANPSLQDAKAAAAAFWSGLEAKQNGAEASQVHPSSDISHLSDLSPSGFNSPELDRGIFIFTYLIEARQGKARHIEVDNPLGVGMRAASSSCHFYRCQSSQVLALRSCLV